MAIHRKTLRDNGIRLISVTENIPDSPEGVILESILEGMAEYYSLDISQKPSEARRRAASKETMTVGLLPTGTRS